MVCPQESQTYERKTSVGEWQEIVETVAAFATANGGTIEVGIRPDGSTAGVEIGAGTIEDLVNKIRQNTDPRQAPSVHVTHVGRKKLIVLRVSESSDKPVLAFGRPYKRVAKTNHRLSSSEMRQLLSETGAARWEESICAAAGLEDLSEERVQQFVAQMREGRGRGAFPADNAEAVLRRLGLLTDDGMTRAGIVLFGVRPSQYFPQAQVHCALFAGTEALEFIDMQVVGGDLFAQVEGALDFVTRNIRRGIEITGAKPAREDRWDYPLAAVREAVVNAICHRDYEETGNAQVRVFNDRLEVWNPGLLVPELTVEALKGDHRSIPRNPLIADCFYRAGYIERWGTGTNRIIQECVASGAPEPDFEERPGDHSFVVRMRKSKLAPAYVETLGLNERQLKAIDFLRKNDEITNAQYRELTGVHRATATKELRRLADLGIVKLVGRGPAARHVVARN